ncbi:disease resistance protein RUN1-like [Rosa rugosa]|uniref:disease resistance protein RUN1-like n=1 Tax=Rosa rugosa TaxID=74645 RepID=UPI002B40BB36|nr:disease resistance protein RUN1-like [Rosa rugosa]
MPKVLCWRAALTEAANLAGWSFLDGYESKFIHDIVGEISAQVLNCTYLNVADYPVGMEPRVLHVNMLLDVEEKDVRMVGIWGIGGIGKTTVAKAVCNSIVGGFEGSCFLENVRENSMRDGGLVELQNTLLFDILGEKRLKVNNSDKGINVIKKMLSHKRVLLVLDDVNHLDQLKKLAGGVDWFGIGSRIVITTRDKHLLTAHQINLIYKVKELNYNQATVLFSWNAFARKRHQVDKLIVETALQYAQGLPLALIHLGSRLCGRSTDECKAALDCHARVPNQEIQEILKISYNALEDPVKEVFLDIACFFKGKKRNYVVETLESCELNPKYRIEVLVDNAIISIERDNIWMHDLIEAMGREIVRQESPTEPGRRSRLWFHEDVYHGTDNIKGIVANLPKSDVNCDICKFLKSIPDFSGIPNLVYLNLNYCESLAEVHPSVGFLKRLVHLSAEKCSSLEMFPPRLSLRSLETFLLGGCSKLKSFPEIVGTMKSLKCITLPGTAIRELPLSIGYLSGLQELNLNECEDLTNLPCSIYELQHLQYLFLDSCPKLVAFPHLENSEVSGSSKLLPLVLPKLLRFNMGGCNLSKSNLLATLDCLSTLQELDLSGSNFVSLPICISKFVNLLDLNLCCCKRLRKIPQLPPKVCWVDVGDCKSLETFPKLSNILESRELQGIEWMDLFNCHRLCDNLHYEVAEMDNIFQNQVSFLSLYIECLIDVTLCQYVLDS